MARAEAIVGQMTLDEKIGQLHGIENKDHYRYVPGVARLGIPPLGMTNGPAGAAKGQSFPQRHATALPSPILLAASWDPALARRYGALAASEAKALGSDLIEGPDVNIIRLPQGGRSFENFTEDPYLDSRLAVATIEGIQSQGVLATVKHFIANNQEDNRHGINEIVGERALREIYMPAFKASVQQADVASVMCAYPRVNGEFNCENRPLLTGVLKREWHFKGFVMSDFHAARSTVASALNGLDLEMPAGKYFAGPLKAAVQQGEVPVSVINLMLVRRYSTMIRFGLFCQQRAPRTPIPVLEDGLVARKIAEQGMVLLKNKSQLLPLSDRLESIALIGPFAMRAKTGGGGSSHVIPFYSIEPEDAITAHLVRIHRRIDEVNGCDIKAAVAAAKRDEVAVVMVGDNDTEGQDQSIQLPAAQDALIQAVADANSNTIVVVKTGSAILMPWLDSVSAVLEAWYPGEEDGNAVAEVLFGEVDPSGKLPITFPASVKQTPARNPAYYPGVDGKVRYGEGIDVGYRWYQAHDEKPLFPFGFGLSYTTFSFSNLKITSSSHKDRPFTIHFLITNTGHQTGAEVAQVYIGFPPIAEGDEPPRQLKGFRKVNLAPGQSREIAIPLNRSSFSYWSVKASGWKVQPGHYTIMVGSSSEDLPLRSSVSIQ